MEDRCSFSRHFALVITALGAGGAERVMTSMANHWVKSGHQVSLITYEEPEARSYYDLDNRVQLRRLDLADEHPSPTRGLIRTFRRILALRRCLKALRPDVTIAFLTRVNIVTLLAASGQDLPVIVSERNHPDRQPLSRFWLWLRDRVYRRAAAIVYQTEGAKQCYPPELRAKGVVIANPLGTIRKASQPADKRTLVAVGRLSKQKGFDLLLRAFADINADFPDWTLTIWGEGNERPALEALRDGLGLTSCVQMPGLSIGHGAWIDQAGLFVLSSRFEGMPNVLLEAMAAGLPVVAFDCALGPGEMIEHEKNGILVAPENVDAMARNLSMLMADGAKRARLALEAEHSANAYQLETIMTDWSDLVDAVLADRERVSVDSLTPLPIN
ncbi:MAG: glycosyltransferase family 4 protein [Geminicoccaceae bacterium]